MSDAIIQTEALTKRYSRKVLALDGLSLTVERGEVFGYLGPNGAGKTTTIRLLLDLIRPTSGAARVFGLDARRDSVAVRARIGYLPGELNLWQNSAAREIIALFARARGGYDRRFADEVIERLQFDPLKPMRAYSTGNKRKLGLILALMNRPELLILDEPTSGLDPLMQQVFNELIAEARPHGQTVFLFSHVLSEVQAVCDRVAILRGGVLQAVERVETLTRADFRYVILRMRGGVQESLLAGVPGISAMTVRDGALHFHLAGDFDPLLRALSVGYVEMIDVREPTLEEIFLRYYEQDTRVIAGQGVAS